MKKNKKILLPIFLILIFFLGIFLRINSNFSSNWQIVISKWDNFQKFIKNLSYKDQIKVKLNLKLNSKEIPNILVWTYKFSWEYNVDTFLKTISKWPVQSYIKYTVLEWRSIYDIDFDLTKKWYCKSGDFIKYLSENTKKIIWQYDFLASIDKEHKLKTLEWFLYPDTYNIDQSKPFIKQLLQHQLNTFEKKVWNKYWTKMQNFNKKLQNWGFSNLKLSPWAIINLASIIQKEERNNNNKPMVAGIFINRLSNWIQMGADITLCYWLHKSYNKCTPSVIVQNLKNKKNKYNTRIFGWLTPTPISNPNANTILAVLNFVKSDNFYYLHDKNWFIHYWETLQQHNQNKNLYLK